jgi:hypothetical protein
LLEKRKMLLSGPIPGNAAERVFPAHDSFAGAASSDSKVFVSYKYQFPAMSLCHISSPPIRSAESFVVTL